nr:MAG TPA: branched-chain phosphotransacylase [Bacteriophage sp.]
MSCIHVRSLLTTPCNIVVKSDGICGNILLHN